jgi:hypothetical protein
MNRPLAIDLFCGLGGWTAGLLAEGYDVIGFDIERHQYGEYRYPAQLVIQDVRTLHGSQFKSAALIVASPPCQKFSYMAMPWSRAKAKAAAIRADESGKMLAELTELFDACFRIQAQASIAAGRHIPMVVENVRGAQKWVGRARWSFGSFYLWGDVPALMPITFKAAKNPGFRFDGSGRSFQSESVDRHIKVPTMGAGWYPPGHPKHVKGLGFNTHAERNLRDDIKNNGGSWFNVARSTTSGKGRNPDGRKLADGTKNGNDWFGSGDNCSLQRRAGSKSPQRKMASAMIAKIPAPLSRHIAATYHPLRSQLRKSRTLSPT